MLTFLPKTAKKSGHTACFSSSFVLSNAGRRETHRTSNGRITSRFFRSTGIATGACCVTARSAATVNCVGTVVTIASGGGAAAAITTTASAAAAATVAVAASGRVRIEGRLQQLLPQLPGRSGTADRSPGRPTNANQPAWTLLLLLVEVVVLVITATHFVRFITDHLNAIGIRVLRAPFLFLLFLPHPASVFMATDDFHRAGTGPATGTATNATVHHYIATSASTPKRPPDRIGDAGRGRTSTVRAAASPETHPTAERYG